jgi:hypothetical protein
MHRQHRLLTEKRIFSPSYHFTVGTSSNAVKCCIISAVLWLEYLQTSLYFYISNSDEIRSPKWSLPKRHLNFSITPWPKFASEPYRQSGRRRSAKLVPTFFLRIEGCHVVSAPDPHGRQSLFSRPELLLFYSSSSSIDLTRLSGPRSRPYRFSIFLFIQQIYVLNILNMLHTLRFFLFKMSFIS